MGRPNPGDSMKNFREWDGPLREKLRLAAQNNWRKARRLDRCCGNPGEPGC